MVSLIARLAPWLAPIPSAFFVARSSVAHLEVPIEIAIIIGAVLELLGIATVHTALNLYRWNVKPAVNKEKGAWERAPLPLAVATCAVYFAAVVFLSVFLETAPNLAAYAPIVFPFVAVVGALTLAIISQHEARVAKYARTDTGAGGIALRDALYHRITARIDASPILAMPALPAPQEHDAGMDAQDTMLICDLCGQAVANGNMGSHRRWHCEAVPARNNGNDA